MGQRLVITVKHNNEELAKIYYHWSAYSVSALEETKEIINVLYDDENKIKDLRLRLIRFCERNGGGIDGGKNSKEWKYISKMYPNETFSENIDRNYGLIAISEEGMEEMQYWSEGDVEIELGTSEVFNSVYSYFSDIETYNRERSEWDDDFEGLTLENFPELSMDLEVISIFDIDKVIKELKSLDDFICRYNDTLYELTA